MRETIAIGVVDVKKIPLMLEEEETQLSPKIIIIAAIVGWLLAAPIIFDAWKNPDSGCPRTDVDSPKKELTCSDN